MSTYNILRSNCSTITTSNPCTLDTLSSRSFDKFRTKEGVNLLRNSSSETFPLNAEIILIKKEKNYKKLKSESSKAINEYESRKTNLKRNIQVDNVKSAHLNIINSNNSKENHFTPRISVLQLPGLGPNTNNPSNRRKSMKVLELGRDSIKPVLKKKKGVYNYNNYNVEASFRKKKSVRFVDQNITILSENNDHIEIPPKPLAQIIRVETYRHYKIYAGDIDEHPEKEEAKVKAKCNCGCLIF